jgi:hypothetical protein
MLGSPHSPHRIISIVSCSSYYRLLNTHPGQSGTVGIPSRFSCPSLVSHWQCRNDLCLNIIPRYFPIVSEFRHCCTAGTKIICIFLFAVRYDQNVKSTFKTLVHGSKTLRRASLFLRTCGTNEEFPNRTSETIKVRQFQRKKCTYLVVFLAAWSYGIVSAFLRGDWSYESWDRIPPGYM